MILQVVKRFAGMVFPAVTDCLHWLHMRTMRLIN
jgi:hypothetical protein